MNSDEALEGAISTMTTFGNAPGTASASSEGASGLARALELYRDYLTLVARRAIGPELAARLGASDVVQETFLAAQQHIGTFRGRTEPEWRARAPRPSRPLTRFRRDSLRVCVFSR